MMINKRAIALMLPVALSACAATTVRGLRDREPVLVSDSARDATAITNCVSEKWVVLGMTPRTLPRENGSTILVEQVVTYALPILVVDMDTKASGTHVTMRQFKSIWSKQNRARVEEVRACL